MESVYTYISHGGHVCTIIAPHDYIIGGLGERFPRGLEEGSRYGEIRDEIEMFWEMMSIF